MLENANKIKVLHVIDAGAVGGAELFLYSLLSEMIKYEQFSVEVCFAMSKGVVADLIAGLGIKTHCLNVKNGLDLINATKLKKLIEEKQYNIIHSHTDQLLTNFFVGFSHSSLKVLTGHGAIISDFPVKKRLGHHLLKGILRSYEYLIGVSEFVRNSMIAKFGFPSERVLLIRNGINLAQFSKIILPAQQQKEKLGLPLHKKIVGTVGRLFPDKGTDHLIFAAPTILREYPDCFFLVVGDGLLRQELETKVENMGLSGNFKFLGQREDIPELLSIMDILVFPSVREGLPIAAIEGMAMGKPIVAYAVGGMPELILHNETGLLVKQRDPIMLGNSIVSLLKNENLCSQMGIDARRIALKEFDINTTARRHIDFYLLALKNDRTSFMMKSEEKEDYERSICHSG